MRMDTGAAGYRPDRYRRGEDRRDKRDKSGYDTDAAGAAGHTGGIPDMGGYAEIRGFENRKPSNPIENRLLWNWILRL